MPLSWRECICIDFRGLGFILFQKGGQHKDEIWDFPKFGGTLFWGPYNKDPTIQGTTLGSPNFGNPPHICLLLSPVIRTPDSRNMVWV